MVAGGPGRRNRTEETPTSAGPPFRYPQRLLRMAGHVRSLLEMPRDPRSIFRPVPVDPHRVQRRLRHPLGGPVARDPAVLLRRDVDRMRHDDRAVMAVTIALRRRA